MKNFPGNSREVPGRFQEEIEQNSWEFPGKSEKFSGEFPGKSEKNSGRIKKNPPGVSREVSPMEV
jgi:hypothetical protein